MLTNPNYHILYSEKNRQTNKEVIMTYLTEEEEKLIDNLGKEVLQLERGSRTFSISVNRIYCYGEVDFHNNEDLKTIDSFNFLDNIGSIGVPVFADYDYETHTCNSPTKHYRWSQTFSPKRLAMFAHAVIGKPQRIILFNQN